MDVCKTGIVGLDNVLDGGIPVGNSVLLSGSSGVGKTILAMEFLFRGARDFGETGIYSTQHNYLDNPV
ncbi:MAG: hypothetical protein MSIBF_03685 [Candidatus Altiarchaeales archaeon IMC4]|nr:MAG: hypothetical protein MSIBF_03685 [Candidatus Altiarchaeales archaeon IMC4]